MAYLIISASLNKKSRSRVLAEYAADVFVSRGIEAELVDLRDYPLPLCDGGESFNHPLTKQLQEKISRAEGILVGAPVYNYDLNAAIKNVFDLTGSAWEGKIVGVMVTAGGRGSYMAPMAFMNALMLNSRCLVIPRFVYAPEKEVTE
ncbi:MAG: NAD(P)H-dependent oxidoreductase, partial [Calditrichaeota bacterium]|nr:NAD(P)H-dependent oxidoreductase [Calditrichota bacterium]